MKSSISSQTLSNEVSYHQQHLKEAVSLAIQQDTDMVIVSKDKTLIFCHSSLLALFSPLIARLLSGVPCCSSPTVFLPDFPTLPIQKLIHLLKFGQAIPGRNVNADIEMINKIANVLEISKIDINLEPFLDNPLGVPFEVKKELNGFVIKEEVNSIKEEKTVDVPIVKQKEIKNSEYIEEITKEFFKLENLVTTDQLLPDVNDNEWMVEEEIIAQGANTFDVKDGTVGTIVQVDTSNEKGNNESIELNIRIKRPACVLGSTETFPKKLRTSSNLEIGDKFLTEKQIEAPVATQAASSPPLPVSALGTTGGTNAPPGTTIRTITPTPVATQTTLPAPSLRNITQPQVVTQAYAPAPPQVSIQNVRVMASLKALPGTKPNPALRTITNPSSAPRGIAMTKTIDAPCMKPRTITITKPSTALRALAMPKTIAKPSPAQGAITYPSTALRALTKPKTIDKLGCKTRTITTLTALPSTKLRTITQPTLLTTSDISFIRKQLKSAQQDQQPHTQGMQAMGKKVVTIMRKNGQAQWKLMGKTTVSGTGPKATLLMATEQGNKQVTLSEKSSSQQMVTEQRPQASPDGVESGGANLGNKEILPQVQDEFGGKSSGDTDAHPEGRLEYDGPVPDSEETPRETRQDQLDVSSPVNSQMKKKICQKIEEDKNSHKSDLDQYTRFSDERKFESVTCCICGLEFKEVEEFRKHSRILHPFTCSHGECQKRFTTHKNLNGHLAKDHSFRRFGEEILFHEILFHRGWLSNTECNQTTGNQERSQH